MQPARFITLDGIDGAGKTTQLNIIHNWFQTHHLPVYFTREPGGTPLGEDLRKIILNPAIPLSKHTETLLIFAARQQHLDTIILPMLAQGTNIVCDRFTDATFAYQGGGHGVTQNDIAILEQWVQKDIRPDLTLILDVSPEISQKRLSQDNRDKDRFEQESVLFFNRVRQIYLQRAATDPQRYTVIDSSQDKTKTQTQIESRLSQLFNV